MLARSTNFVSRKFSGSSGSKFSKTLSATDFVSRVLRSHAYSPDQRNVLPGTRCTPVASMLRDLPKLKFRFGKIVAHHADQLDRRKKTRAHRGVGSGTAELIGVFLDRCFDGIERDGTNNENGHGYFWISDF